MMDYYPADKEYNKSETKMMSSEEKKMYGDYNGKMMAEYDVKVLTQAAEIRGDEKRHKKAMVCAEHKRRELGNI